MGNLLAIVVSVSLATGSMNAIGHGHSIANPGLDPRTNDYTTGQELMIRCEQDSSKNSVCAAFIGAVISTYYYFDDLFSNKEKKTEQQKAFFCAPANSPLTMGAITQYL